MPAGVDVSSSFVTMSPVGFTIAKSHCTRFMSPARITAGTQSRTSICALGGTEALVAEEGLRRVRVDRAADGVDDDDLCRLARDDVEAPPGSSPWCGSAPHEVRVNCRADRWRRRGRRRRRRARRSSSPSLARGELGAVVVLPTFAGPTRPTTIGPSSASSQDTAPCRSSTRTRPGSGRPSSSRMGGARARRAAEPRRRRRRWRGDGVRLSCALYDARSSVTAERSEASCAARSFCGSSFASLALLLRAGGGDPRHAGPASRRGLGPETRSPAGPSPHALAPRGSGILTVTPGQTRFHASRRATSPGSGFGVGIIHFGILPKAGEVSTFTRGVRQRDGRRREEAGGVDPRNETTGTRSLRSRMARTGGADRERSRHERRCTVRAKARGCAPPIP